MYKISSEPDNMTKHFSVFFVSQFQVLFTYQMRMPSFTSQRRGIIQEVWKTFILVYNEFTQDNTHQLLSECAGFCGRYNKKHFGVLFLVHSAYKQNYLI